MEIKTFEPHPSISLFVKNIMIFEEHDATQKTVLPFFADGYPGLIFQETANGLMVNPHQKLMPAFFLYGQTIKPIEMVMTGTYKLIIFQLYPFVLQSFFGVSAQELNDNCYDLSKIADSTIPSLQKVKDSIERSSIISSFLNAQFLIKKKNLDLAIAFALKKIIQQKGQISIKEIHEELHLTERTFERRFLTTVGITAKQFAKMIQFQESLQQLTLQDYTKLSDIVYANGFADQSHFIKVFKAFTGKTPLAFQSQR